MKSLIPLVAGGAAGMMWNVLPRWVKVPAVVGLVALAALELNKDANKSWFSSSIFGGQAAEGESKTVDPLKTEADAKAGKPVSGAARMMAKQVEGLGADAIQKQAVADAASESEQELLAKQAKRVKLSAMEIPADFRIEEAAERGGNCSGPVYRRARASPRRKAIGGNRQPRHFVDERRNDCGHPD